LSVFCHQPDNVPRVSKCWDYRRNIWWLHRRCMLTTRHCFCLLQIMHQLTSPVSVSPLLHFAWKFRRLKLSCRIWALIHSQLTYLLMAALLNQLTVLCTLAAYPELRRRKLAWSHLTTVFSAYWKISVHQSYTIYRMVPFSWPWTTPNSVLKGTPLFNVEYLRNDTR